jgi:hypothetical protein
LYPHVLRRTNAALERDLTVFDLPEVWIADQLIAADDQAAVRAARAGALRL